MKRPATRHDAPATIVQHCTTTPTTKMPTFTKMAYFLDNISEKNPLYRQPNQATSSKIEVSHPFLVWSVTQEPMSARRVSTVCAASHREHTFAERGHREDPRENSLVITVDEPVGAVGQHERFRDGIVAPTLLNMQNMLSQRHVHS